MHRSPMQSLWMTCCLPQTAAKTEKILLREMQKAQPCEIEMGEDGVARCKAGTGVGSR